MRNVLITGGSAGLGKEMVKSFINEGYNVYFTYYKTKPSKELNNAVGIYCDLSSEEDIKKLLRKVKNIDILVNNAAYECNKDFYDKKKKDFVYTMEVNLIGPFLLSRELGKRMYNNKYGKIINISSNNAINKYDPVTIEYDTSKAGVNVLTKILAKEFAPYVNVNAVAPGWILTNKIKTLDDNLNNKLTEDESKKILLNRFANPEEICNLVLFLASDKASYINSEIIRIDGGTYE